MSIDPEAALNRFLSLTRIRGGSGDEAEVAGEIRRQLLDAGLDEANLRFDRAHERTRIKGNTGNLIVSLPGSGTGPRTMLSAHMDTVPICLGSDPVVDGDEVRSGVDTGLGADDRAGCAAILTAIVERLQAGDENFPPAVVTFLIQEEVGLEGARHLDREQVGKVDRAFNFDGGTADKVTTGAIGGERISLTVTGVPAHAGVAPQEGVSAIAIASIAIADLHTRGYHGRVDNEHGIGTCNVGVIRGGDATNVVTPEVTLRAEARSHDAAMRTRIVNEIASAFSRAAAEVTNVAGVTGQSKFESHVDYESFRLREDHPSIEAAMNAIRATGRKPYAAIADGGLDANWLFVQGIEAVTLGCGQKNIHTADERLMIPDYLDACRVATRLIQDS